MDEVYQTEEISAVQLNDSQLVTIKLESGSFIRFQPDTGAQFDVIPVHIYEEVTEDRQLEKVKPIKTSLVAYGGWKIKIIGQVRIRVWRGEASCRLDCRLADSKEIRPILGRKACLGMNIIQYKDNDLLNKAQKDNATVCALADKPTALTKHELMAKFPKVFGEGVGSIVRRRI